MTIIHLECPTLLHDSRWKNGIFIYIYIYETNSVVSKKMLIKVKCFHNGGVVKKALSRCWKRNSFIVATREERLVKPLSVISIRYHLVHSSICAAVLRAVSSSLEFESKTNLQSIDGPRNVCTLLQVNYAKCRVLIVCIQPRETTRLRVIYSMLRSVILPFFKDLFKVSVLRRNNNNNNEYRKRKKNLYNYIRENGSNLERNEFCILSCQFTLSTDIRNLDTIQAQHLYGYAIRRCNRKHVHFPIIR